MRMHTNRASSCQRQPLHKLLPEAHVTFTLPTYYSYATIELAVIYLLPDSPDFIATRQIFRSYFYSCIKHIKYKIHGTVVLRHSNSSIDHHERQLLTGRHGLRPVPILTTRARASLFS